MAGNSPSIDGNQNAGESSYGKRNPRINKPDMFMNAALWMERSALAERPDNFGLLQRNLALRSGLDPLEAERDTEDNESKRGKPVRQESKNEQPEQKQVNKCGAVYVLPNDRALSVDCSQDGVHAAVSALFKFGQERAKGCKVYLSRRPCSFCAKLLVQCEVSKVYFLPIEPEWNDPDDVHRVDNIFKSSSTALSIFIPKVRDNVIKDLAEQESPFSKKRPRIEEVERMESELQKEYWSDEWVENASKVLRWPAFSDEMKVETMKDMKNLMKWIAMATYRGVPDGVTFAEIDPESREAKREKLPRGDEGDAPTRVIKEEIPEIPTTSDKNWQKHALHMTRMARMLSQRSDDPTRRVGCVLMLHNEVVALGWNGFPAKALYGEFPRASSKDAAREKKEPYVIHAEENALLTRNKTNMNQVSSILFSSKIPAPECVPMLIAVGVRNIVVPQEPADPENEAFFEALKPVREVGGQPSEGWKLMGYWPINENDQRDTGCGEAEDGSQEAEDGSEATEEGAEGGSSTEAGSQRSVRTHGNIVKLPSSESTLTVLFIVFLFLAFSALVQ